MTHTPPPLTRQTATAILHEMVANESLRRHCLAVGLLMQEVALVHHEDPDKFFVAGLLHDADWEQFPEQHPKVIVQKINELGASDVAYAISCHGTEFGVPQISLMDKSLIAIDELSGLILAIAKLKPDGFTSITVNSVVKKFKDAKFAAGVSRQEVQKALTILGVEFEPFVAFLIASYQKHAEELGFPQVESPMPIVFPPMVQKTLRDAPKKTARKLSEEEVLRRQKRTELIVKGINPYPGSRIERDVFSSDIHSGTKSLNEYVKMAGRLMRVRDQGKVLFAQLLDATGEIQLYLSSDRLGSDFKLFKQYFDRGDIIAIEGVVFKTKTGELTVDVTSVQMVTKALKPLPAVKTVEGEDGTQQQFDGVTDPEFRYRRRYVDLIINPQVKQIFLKRTKIIDTIRSYWNNFGWYEAQTPILQPIYGGASARPFVTHHNALDIPMYLRIANELYQKRLLVGGFDGVYEFSVDFRNEGMDRTHNPEFQQVELYVAYKDYHWMMDLVEDTVEKVCLAINNTTDIEVWGHQVSFKKPWRRASMRELILEKTTIDIYALDEEGLRQTIAQKNIPIEDLSAIIGKGKLIDELFGATVEKSLIQPTFVTDYPVELSPLAKKNPEDPSLTHRFEAYCVGKEFANAFSELNDPIDQRERFEQQLLLSQRGDTEAMNEMDEDFLRALEYGMPSAAGLGLGIDRLTMLLTNQTSIYPRGDTFSHDATRELLTKTNQCLHEMWRHLKTPYKMKIENTHLSSVVKITADESGPHAVIFGGIHGDEPSGVHAVQKLLFDFVCQNKILLRGSLILALGNEEALQKDVRYISHNLNRIFIDDIETDDSYELKRAKDLMPILRTADYFLDLHSIRSQTEPYAVIEEQNIEFAKQLGIKHIAYDWAKCCEGAAAGDTDNYAIKYGATSVTYEAGSHYEYSSIVHATNTAIRFLQVLGMLPTEQSISSSEESLIYRLTKVKLKEDESFKYTKIYKNFDKVAAGEIIAWERG